jgi:regulator of sigma E protease
MLTSLFYWVLPFIFILGSAVVLHEFGHFIVAKLLGVRVETFSVGFGPRLFGRRWGTTDYRLSLVPLGGYVKLGGDDSNAPIEGATAQNIPANERFDLRPRWQKFLVMVAGPTMNIITALAVVFIAALLSGVPVVPSSPVVTQVRPGGASEIAGVRSGDRIVSFNGKENPSLERIYNDVRLSPEQPLPLTVERGGQRIALTLKPEKAVEEGEKLGVIDFAPDYGALPVTVSGLKEDYPAAQAGLKVGDRVLTINGEQVRDDVSLIGLVQKYKNDEIKLAYERGGQRGEVSMRARLENDRAFLGVTPEIEIPYERAGLATAATYAVSRNVEIIRMTGAAFSQIFKGQRSARESLSGPIGIARASATAAKRLGWAGVFGTLGFLSLNLGVVNLLPIPVLDGGAIFLLILEAVLGWVGLRLSMTVRERIQQVGFVMLILLMGFVITNDLVKEGSNLLHRSSEKPAAAQPAK